ncbi:hypothetical protein OG936_32395 [Streptomyces sp. NBC_00846]|uniref:hypothetical protein n=1 Tax=Streptomyces sp. NBC_00846 TaxID=2975849 RepID=UPI00386A6C49|nr:hypothetical protein OG936_32395 [Streptomyces sp. NBC_00846]
MFSGKSQQVSLDARKPLQGQDGCNGPGPRLPSPGGHRAVGEQSAVNDLCLQALVATFATGTSIVDDKADQSAVTEILD